MHLLELLRFIAIAVLAIAVSSLPSPGATLTYHGQAGTPPGWVTQTEDRCTITLTRPIAPGDAARFAALVAQIAPGLAKHPESLGGPRIATLCLDSEGRALAEALRIADMGRRDRTWFPNARAFIATRLRAEARCEDACALIFLAGTLDDWEGPAYAARSMQPTARLGIHAPALTLPAGGTCRGPDIQAAHDTSLESIAEILRLLHVDEDHSGKLYSDEGNWMVGSMLDAMLRTPPDRMPYIETIDDARRWGIGAEPIGERPIDLQGAGYGCFNTGAWATGHPSTVSPDIISGGGGRAAPLGTLGTLDPSEIARFEISVDEMNGKHNTVVVRTGRARRASETCGAVTYGVTGAGAGTSVTLRGSCPVGNLDCSVSSDRQDVLTFDSLRPQ